MKHFTTPEFWEHFNHLPETVQKLARKNYELLNEDPSHRSLHFKRVGKYRSVRVGRQYRALGIDYGNEIVWFWIGSHAEYDQLIR